MSEDREYSPPVEITIPTPIDGTMPRGIHANKKTDSFKFQLHVSPEIRDVIQEAAKVMNVKVAFFIRWCAYASANRILQGYNLYDQDPERYFNENRTVTLPPYKKVERRRIQRINAKPISAIKVKNPFDL